MSGTEKLLLDVALVVLIIVLVWMGLRRNRHGWPWYQGASERARADLRQSLILNLKIIGASKIARDITERKRNDEHIAMLAREAEHRTKNILATVQATGILSQSDHTDGPKQAIEGRIQNLATTVRDG